MLPHRSSHHLLQVLCTANQSHLRYSAPKPMTNRQEPAATTQTHSAADPGPPGPPRPSAPARQLAERSGPSPSRHRGHADPAHPSAPGRGAPNPAGAVPRRPRDSARRRHRAHPAPPPPRRDPAERTGPARAYHHGSRAALPTAPLRRAGAPGRTRPAAGPPPARGGADRRGGAGRAPGLAADGAGPRSAGGCPFPAAVSINGELGAVQPMAARRNVIP